MNIPNSPPPFQPPAAPAADNNGAAQPAARNNPPPAGAQAARREDAARNRLAGNLPASPRVALRGYIDVVRNNPESAVAVFNLGAEMTATDRITVDDVPMTKRDCYQKALEIAPGHTFAQAALQRLDQAEAAIVAAQGQQHVVRDREENRQLPPDHPHPVDRTADAAVMQAPAMPRSGPVVRRDAPDVAGPSSRAGDMVPICH